jgi:hypothetical protein
MDAKNALETNKYHKITVMFAISPADMACPHQFMRTTLRKKDDIHMKKSGIHTYPNGYVDA